MTIYLIRGAHANEYELQNYYPLKNKFDIKVITSHKHITPIELPTIRLWSPSDLLQFPYRRQLLNRLIGGEQWLIGLNKLIKSRDILHTAEAYSPYTHQAVHLRRAGKIKKLICTCWETIPHNNEKFARLRLWKSEAYRYVDLFHTPTKRAKDALVTEGVNPDKIKIIPYGVDTSKFCPIKKIPNKRPIILTVARLVPEKGYLLWKQVKAKLSNIANFRWVDNIPYHDMPAVYHSADLFFFPSLTTPTWEEQYGMALIEAMACGLPIVASNTGAIPEVIGDNGLLFDPSNLSDVISKISKQLITSKRTRLPPRYSVSYASKQLSTLYLDL